MDGMKVVGYNDIQIINKGKKEQFARPKRLYTTEMEMERKDSKHEENRRKGGTAEVRRARYWQESKGNTKPRKHWSHNFKQYPPTGDSMQLLHRFGLTSG